MHGHGILDDGAHTFFSHTHTNITSHNAKTKVANNFYICVFCQFLGIIKLILLYAVKVRRHMP